MNDTILYPEDVTKLNRVLSCFVQNANLECTFVTGRDGQLITYQGLTGAMDTTSIAALVTGSFAATSVIANLIGEVSFTTLSHQGEHKHIRISLINRDYYLLSIFSNETPVDKVTYYATTCIQQLDAILRKLSENIYDPRHNNFSIATEQEDVSFIETAIAELSSGIMKQKINGQTSPVKAADTAVLDRPSSPSAPATPKADSTANNETKGNSIPPQEEIDAPKMTTAKAPQVMYYYSPKRATFNRMKIAAFYLIPFFLICIAAFIFSWNTVMPAHMKQSIHKALFWRMNSSPISPSASIVPSAITERLSSPALLDERTKSEPSSSEPIAQQQETDLSNLSSENFHPTTATDLSDTELYTETSLTQSSQEPESSETQQKGLNFSQVTMLK